MEYNHCKSQAEVVKLAKEENPARKVCTLREWGYLPPLNKLHAASWSNHRAYGTGHGDIMTGTLLWWSASLGVAVTENSVYLLDGDEKKFIG
jgi:hypothetical protein